MQLEAKKYLFDVRQACAWVAEFTAGKNFTDHTKDPMLRAAVERQFEIIGEALNCLAKPDATVVEQITDHRRIIAFRNILVHAYGDRRPATLIVEVDELLSDGDSD